MSRDRTVIDNSPAAWILVLHDFERLLGAVEGAIQVSADDLQPLLRGQVLEDTQIPLTGVQLVDGQNRLQILERIEDGTVIFSAHGVSPDVRRRATEKGLRWIDATCPDVIRTHDLARDMAYRRHRTVNARTRSR